MESKKGSPASAKQNSIPLRCKTEKVVRMEEACSSFTSYATATSSLDNLPPTCSIEVHSQRMPGTGIYCNRIEPVELFQDDCYNGFIPEQDLQDNNYVETPVGVPRLQPLCEDTHVHLAEHSLGYWESPVGSRNNHTDLLSINVGGLDGSVICGGINFQRDVSFVGGDVVTTNAQIGDGSGLELYQSARHGDFLYKFLNLEAGEYLVDVHLAEIVLVTGPSGARVFDVFIQEEKVVSSVDIYAAIGSNQPMVLSNLKALVDGQDGLSIRFEGVVGKPIVCGISIEKNHCEGGSSKTLMTGSMLEITEEIQEQYTADFKLENGKCMCCKQLKDRYSTLLEEQNKVERELCNVKMENELKARECQEAWASLQDVKMELMRKSMHVGSLAFAIEGQVKDKSKWFLCLRNLSEKFEMLKMGHAKVSQEALGYRRCLEDMVSLTKTIQTTVDNHFYREMEFQELRLKFLEEASKRKDIYNKLIELRGNIRVFCRCRPPTEAEMALGLPCAVDFESAKDGDLIVKVQGIPKKIFKFDNVFSPEECQENVFEKTAPLATSVLDGYNVCIFAYGQTGTGKTFTMEGTEEARGVNYRTLEEIFRIIAERQGLFRYEITVSAMEVYNEQIHDLLLSGSQPGVASKRLEVRCVSEGLHHVPGLVEARVSNMSEVWDVLQTGSKSRAVGSTNANEHSSRSHCIHCVMVKGENLMTGECTRSKLWLIDLAGSERVGKTDAQGDRLKEAQSINKSLSALGDVISALTTKSPHIPFRNSKLTHLLQDSLGGDSKTLMFVQISPNENDVGETLCSLNFASRVRGIELGLAKKQVDGGETFKYKQMAEKMKQDNKYKDDQIKKQEETIHYLEMKNKSRDTMNKNLQDKIKELESQLLIERRLARQHVDRKIAEHQNLASSPVPFPDENRNTIIEQPSLKEARNVLQPVLENCNRLSPLPAQINDKENKPDLCDEETFVSKPDRVSLCPIRQAPYNSIPRRNSLIPLPSVKPAALALLHNTRNLSPPPMTPLHHHDDNSNREPRNVKKVNSILRRSLQKKVIIRSPMQQNLRRGGAVGHDKLRVSTGGSSRKARRAHVSNGAIADRESQQKHQKQKEKERGWNLGTTTKTPF